MSNYLIIAHGWFRAQPWQIKVWVATCTGVGAILGILSGNRLAAPLLASLGF